MADGNTQSLRHLKIKTGVVKRLFKEEKTYRTETEEARQRLSKLQRESADGADIRNAERVVKDSEQMIPRTQESLKKATEELEDLVNALPSESSIADSEEYKAAKSQLDEVRA